MSGERHLEIERKFLLDRVPNMPRAAAVWHIEQGYLDPSSPPPHSGHDEFRSGRLRRILFNDGSTRCFHTIKSGVGIARLENEREISVAEFEQHWPRTANRRLTKTRHRIADGNLVWEIDVFDDLPLALAEIELPSIEVQPEFPDWLKLHVIREVTYDPQYTNASIAARVVHMGGA